jgi:hypothetical protein
MNGFSVYGGRRRSFAREGVEIATDFQDEQDTLVSEFALGGILAPGGATSIVRK